MIDKKKILQRLNKGSKLKEYPLLNLYILVAAFFQVLGELTGLWLLRSLKPLPLLLMVMYIHGKNSARKHLVPSLVQAALVVFLLVDLVLAVGDEPSMVVLTAVRIMGHLVLWVSLSLGEQVRQLGEFEVVRELVGFRWARRMLSQRSFRKLAYLLIIGTTAGVLYLIAERFQNKVIYYAYYGILSIQLCVTLWRYQITLRSSFFFALIGTTFLLISAWLSLWTSGAGQSLTQLFHYCGHYFLMHGALHQSNLQFQIDKLQDNLRRNY